MRSRLNIFALASCGLFLAGNITYDQLGTDEQPPDYRIFYVPLSVMIFALILLCKESAKLQGNTIQALWWFFLWLSISQMIKMWLFNPFIKTINDYGFLVVALIFFFYKLLKKQK